MVSKHGRAQRQVKFECMEEPKGRSKSWKSPKAENRNMAELTSRKKMHKNQNASKGRLVVSFLSRVKKILWHGHALVASAYGCWTKWMPLVAKDLDQGWPQTWHVAKQYSLWAQTHDGHCGRLRYGHVLANWHWLRGRAWLLLGHAGALGHLGLGRWLGVGALGLGALGSHGLAGGALGCSWLAVGHHGCWDLELVAVAQWSLLGPRAAHTTRFDAGMLQVHKYVLYVCNMTALPQSSHFCSQEHCFGWSCVVTHPAICHCYASNT